MTNYATLAQVKAAAGITDAIDDETLTMAIAAASRTVDGYCERRFFTAGTETRYYAPESAWVCQVDDIAGTAVTVASSSGLDGVYDVTWTPADVQFEPLNRTASGIAFPITRLRAVQDYLFPTDRVGETSVQVTAVYGFATAVPDEITYATTLLALRQWSRFKSPGGVIGFGDLGGIRVSRVDPDVQAVLSTFRRTVVGSA